MLHRLAAFSADGGGLACSPLSQEETGTIRVVAKRSDTGASLSGSKTQLCYLLVGCPWGPYFLFWVSMSPKTELASFPHRDLRGLRAQIHAKGLGSVWRVQRAQ